MKKGPVIETATHTKNTGYRQKITKKRLVQRQDNKKETGYRNKIMKKRQYIETGTNEKGNDKETKTKGKGTGYIDWNQWKRNRIKRPELLKKGLDIETGIYK